MVLEQGAPVIDPVSPTQNPKPRTKNLQNGVLAYYGTSFAFVMLRRTPLPPMKNLTSTLPAIPSLGNQGERHRGLLRRAKQLAGRSLLELCETFPALKPVLRPLGLRTWAQWPADRPYRVSLPDGQTFRLAGRNYLSFELFWKGTGYYEPITTLVTSSLLRPGDTFLDIGANVGFYSLVLSTLNPLVRITSFEPNPRNFGLLQNNAMLNGYANIRCEPIALSDSEGTARLYLSKSDMSASLVPGFDEGGALAPVEVRTITLDAYLAKHPTKGRVVIKVDVEGHETAFFRGAARTLSEKRPDIITEVTMPYDPVVMDFLKKLGYRFYPITDQGLFPTDQLRPVIRDRFVFLNYLVSTRPPEEIARLFAVIAPTVRKLDLRQTSKYLTPEALAHFTQRSVEAAPIAGAGS